MPRLLQASALAQRLTIPRRLTLPVRLSVAGVITPITLTPALLMDTTVLTGFPVASSSAPARGSAVGMDARGAGDGAILGVDGAGVTPTTADTDGATAMGMAEVMRAVTIAASTAAIAMAEPMDTRPSTVATAA